MFKSRTTISRFMALMLLATPLIAPISVHAQTSNAAKKQSHPVLKAAYTTSKVIGMATIAGAGSLIALLAYNDNSFAKAPHWFKAATMISIANTSLLSISALARSIYEDYKTPEDSN